MSQMLAHVALSLARVERLHVSIGTALRACEQQQAKHHHANTLPEPAREDHGCAGKRGICAEYVFNIAM